MFKYIIIPAILFFVGCSQKEYFKPENVKGTLYFDGKLSSEIKYVSKDGATLSDLKVINSNLVAEDGFKFLSETDGIGLFADCCGKLKVGDLVLEFEKTVLSATLKGNNLAVILSNNTFILFDLNSKTTIFKDKRVNVTSIDTRVAKPIFLDDLLLYPTLDGKIVVLDLNKREIIKDIAVDSNQFFSNLIFLEVDGEKLIGATKERAIIVDANGVESKQFNIKEIAFAKDMLYILTKEGKVFEVDMLLNIKKELKFPFANFVGIIVKEDKLYLFEREGYMIILEKDFKEYSIYKLNSGRMEAKSFIMGDKFYYHDTVLTIK